MAYLDVFAYLYNLAIEGPPLATEFGKPGASEGIKFELTLHSIEIYVNQRFTRILTV